MSEVVVTSLQNLQNQVATARAIPVVQGWLPAVVVLALSGDFKSSCYYEYDGQYREHRVKGRFRSVSSIDTAVSPYSVLRSRQIQFFVLVRDLVLNDFGLLRTTSRL
jgi:hypothetical protein